ncbi:MAG TPA: glycosyltransferase [Vicinamibacterales bacterium]|nr:glycosyltransferase [Vicinamibacterales bacterium]
MRTAVIVIGDLGRSPRMQYHAASLAAAGSEVDLIGLEGAAVMPALASDARIQVHRLPDGAFAGRTKGGVRRFVFSSVARGLQQAVRLFAVLVRIPKPDVILVQNPPAFPTLFITFLVSRLRRARFVIDWHNLSHTIAAVKVGERHRAVKAIARSERRWAKRADAHLTVSNALAEWMAREYRVKATVVYDRPGDGFIRASGDEARALWEKIARDFELLQAPALRSSSEGGRPPIVVCPTSWSPDEDFDLLLEALERAERQLTRGEAVTTPQLIVFLTGRGPLRETFETRAARRTFKAIAVRTIWLEPADYPKLIGMADLGLCLHQSSSGLDLPMKLADLRGAAVPVAVYDYAPVLNEVLTVGHEGVTFRDPGDLANLLVAVAKHSIAADSPMGRSRSWLLQNAPERWQAQWEAAARPVLIP